MNKFEQISRDGHQMSLVGGDQGWNGGPRVSYLGWRDGGWAGAREVLRSHVLGAACTVRSNVSWVM